MRRILIAHLLVLCGFGSFAQYGNEWINFNQLYWKLQVAEDGFYRVSASELAAQGFPVTQVSAENIKVFRNGEEVAVLVSPSTGPLEHLEFYGQRNDGQLDEGLYTSPEAQPHQRYSLFTDTTTYFLTYEIAGSTGKRITLSTDNDNSGLTPEAYHWADTTNLQTSSYATGFQYGDQLLGQWDVGEGWTGPDLARGASATYNFTLDNAVTTGPAPRLEMVMIGRNSLAHVVEISAGPDNSSLRVVATTDTMNFSNRTSLLLNTDLAWTDIGSGGEVVVQASVLGRSGAQDRIAISYLQVQYPKTIDFDGDQERYDLASTSGGRSYLRVNAANPSSVRAFDISDPANLVRILTNALSDRIELIVNGSTTEKDLLLVEDVKTVPTIEGFAFDEIDVSTADYIILTHPDLSQPDSVANADPVADYATYRRSSAGGGYDVVVANIQDVYDQFGYGIPTPLAVRNMLQRGYETGNLRWMFIVGRGRTVNAGFYRNRNVEHFVPTYGTPGSDMLFGVFEGSDLPRIGMGRLTAISPEEVRAYLDKIVEHEAVPYDALWRKNLIQLSGGQNAFELSRFRGYVSSYAEIAEEDFLGGRSATLSKETTANVEFLNIREEVNRGIGMITFFGHSGPAITDIEVDPADRFNNKGRYPSVFLVNGCNAGEIFAASRSFGEDWVTLRDKGSTNFIAHTDLALSTSLNTYSRLFYEVTYGDSATFANTLGEILVEVGSRYLSASSSTSAQAQVYPMLLQGDPANRAFGANAPDYEINTSSVRATSLQGGEVLASQDSFRVEVIVQNFGRTTFDSLDIAINQTLPSGKIVNVSRTFERIRYADTLELFVPIDVTDNVAGSNTLEVSIDPQGAIAELDETNNLVILDLFISSGNTVQLFPINQGIVSDSEVSLTWQPFGSSADRAYELQIDTVSTYNSPYLVTGNESGSVLITRSLDLSGMPDSTTLFWRSRFAEPATDEDTTWTESTFTYLPQDTTGGWGQFAIEQRLTSTLEGTNYNAATGRWEFDQTSNSIRLSVFGPDNTELAYEDIEVLVNDIDLISTSSRIDPVCVNNTFNAIAFDRQSSNPYFPIQFNQQPGANRLICGRTPQFIHNFTENDLVGDNRWMAQLIDNMDDGDQIVLFTIGENTFSNWDTPLIDKLAEVGIEASVIEGLTDGQPAIFFGTKGAAAGTATSITGNTTGFPIREQLLTFSGEATGRFTSGRLITQPIGPATKWWQFDYSLTEDPSDNLTVNVIGITPSGQEVVQFSEGRMEELDVSSIDAEQYPNLRIEASFNDEIALTPPQVNYLRLYYETPPDGILLNPSDQGMQLLQEGDSLETSFSFYNYSATDFSDSVRMTATFRDGETGTEFIASAEIQGPAAGDTITFQVQEPTVGRVGEYGLRVRMDPQEPEIYAVNNAAVLSQFARVEPDRVNPILDVTFDGAYILNGDLVSPTPMINIVIKDQNTVLTKTDTTGVTVSLRRGDEGAFERVPFSSPQINWTPASDQEDFNIQYEPGPLEDNRYALRVEGTDGSGNAAGAEPYEITFEVVNESSITRFFPYPNPFSTSTRFVFTLTGAEVPDEIKIQIMTVTGRVVREILQDEIGPIRVGNNITQYAWDGRDEFGDQLANGVYLYRVITRINGEEVKNRGTAADQAFKHGYGKLYLLR